MRSWIALIGSLMIHGGVIAIVLLSIKEEPQRPNLTTHRTITLNLGVLTTRQSVQTLTAETSKIIQKKTAHLSTPQPHFTQIPKKNKPIKKTIDSPQAKPKNRPTSPKKLKSKAKLKPKKTQPKRTQKSARIHNPPTLISKASTDSRQNHTNHVKNSHQQHNQASINAYQSELTAAITRVANRYYPRQALRLRQQGIVHVRFHLSTKGRISQIIVTKSSGKQSLDRAAMNALKKLGKYKPPPPGFASQITVPIQFRLR